VVWAGAIGPAVALVTGGAVVGAIWSAPLAVGVKAAVTACIALLVVVALVALASYAVSLSARMRGGWIDSGSITSSSLGDNE
jgi:hypothetical protein